MWAFALVATTAGVTPPAFAERGPRAKAAIALARGTFVDGPRHTWRAITRKPLRYGTMLLGLGVAGASAKALGIDPAVPAVTVSAIVYGWQLRKAWPGFLRTRGSLRLRYVGANVIWPGLLVGGTAWAGTAVGHGPVGGGSGAAVARAGAQTAVITADIPTIVQHGHHHKHVATDHTD